MSSTSNLQQTLIWTGPYVRYQPLTIGGMNPALKNANLIKQTILGAPFTWPWNRSETTPIVCVAGQQDYVADIPDFGFIEKAWITLAGDTKEIENKRVLAKDSNRERPAYIAAQVDDGAGNITFRLLPSPDAAYSLSVCYQRKAGLMASVASLWDPIPDEMAYLYEYGFLGLSMMVTGDSRFPIFNDRFVAHLLGAQDGLDEMQRNIFMGNWLDVVKQIQRSQLSSQQGSVARTR